MSEIRSLTLETRNALGTGPTRALRRTGYVPVSLYGKKLSPKNMAIEERVLVKEMKEKGFWSHLFQVSVDGSSKKVLIKGIQKHPVSDRPLHLDLMAIDEDSRVRVDVAIKTLNEEKSPGLKLGGLLNLLRHSLPVICSPGSIPEFIEVDLGSLKMGASVHLADLKLPAGVEIEHPEKIETILTIAQPKVSSGSDDSSETTTAEPQA
ncbi:MAG: 50S ribosomal protein L25/general stress protein Ctc [Alphaproteobacteria bacterium]